MRHEFNTAAEEKIFNAATDIFLQKGRHGARMQEIADRAGINKAMLHYYFRSKDKLYAHVFSTVMSRFFNNLLDALADTDDLHEFLESFVENYTEHLATNQNLIRFIFWEMQSGAEFLSSQLQQLFRGRGLTGPPFIEMIRKAIDRGEIRPVDPVQFVLSLIAMCVYPFLAKPLIEQLFAGVEIDSLAFRQIRKAEVLNLIWRGIGPE